ncbi:hypothetical protein BVC80_1619g20 [Macleaya cordata]|uniref:Uncharacterized protein n=1 Tax=Macleaya cordata TaxID=56857 RepID=A0A200QDV2_MACCD|nr:hypothetical protein BVC80_1619g20 [Macleaya cordata]
MRIRGSSSISSPSSYCSSISTFSLVPSASSTNSLVSFSSNCSSSIDYETRCEGLDLLVKAVLHVAGSVLVVPFTQRRVIRRRKRAFRFCNSFVTEFGEKKEEREDEQEQEQEEREKGEEKQMKGERIEVISKPKKRKRVMALPTKYHDSVLQPWIRRTRRRQSIEINEESG